MSDEQKQSFEQTYPNIVRWVKSYGWIELGQDDYSTSFVRAIDGGGLIWEGRNAYQSMEEVFQELNAALGTCFHDVYGE